MIPKIIHYCWFGGGPLPEFAKICINSWKIYFPDYEIKEWNESNYNIGNCCEYVKEAYSAKKWAFVSDYVRFDILYKYGGVYFDTDVEVIAPFDDILKKGAFMGIEKIDLPGVHINPGLGCASEAKNQFLKTILDKYTRMHFIKSDGSENLKTIVETVSEELNKQGVLEENLVQSVCGIMIYPSEYFCPINCSTGRKNVTKNTKSVHWYSDSWGNKNKVLFLNIQRKFDAYGKIGHIIGIATIAPLKVYKKINDVGIMRTFDLIIKKLKKG